MKWRYLESDGYPSENISIMLCLKDYYEIINSDTFKGRSVWKRKYEICIRGLTYLNNDYAEYYLENNHTYIRFNKNDIEKYIYMEELDSHYFREEFIQNI